MKAANLLNVVAIALVLATSATGCKKKVQNPTPLPKYGVGQTGGDGLSNPLDRAPALPAAPSDINSSSVPANTDGSIPQTASAEEKLLWPQNRDIFKDQTVYFAFDKSNVREGEIPKLETVANAMKTQYAGKAILVEGHCDERGTEEYNRALGEQRALAIRETLVKLGMSPNDVVILTFGEEKPAVQGTGDAVWSKNRRGEIILLSPPGSAAP